MDHHHRRSISVFVLLSIIAIIYAHERTIVHEVQTPIVATHAVQPEVIIHGDRNKKHVTFTFDGGEGNQSAEAILHVLAKHHVTGTFFLTGKWIGRNQDMVKRMKAEGHEIYNHSFDHPHFTELNTEEIATQLRRTDIIFEALTGSSTRPYFRPPYGDYDERIVQVAAREGYHTVMWTADAGDWMESEGYTADHVRARIMAAVQPGAIILMHIGDTITGSILDEVFTTLEAQGYQLTSLSQAVPTTPKLDTAQPFTVKIGW
jgi:delta-lactam-biosynthetic de-N-acetylase